MARENTQRNDEYNNSPRNDPRLVDADFVANQGLSAKAGLNQGRTAANEATYRKEAANEARYEEIRMIAEAEAEEGARRALLRRQKTIETQSRAKGALTKAKGAAGLARWGGLAVAGTAWVWQFLCAAVSLVFLGMWGSIDALLESNFLGKSVKWVAGLFNVDLATAIPVDTFAMVFWALATLIALCTFIGFLLFFTFTGVRVFNSTISLFLASLVFALSIMPVSNLFPWIPLWVVYINVTSTAQLLGGAVRSGRT
jgi:hypothetical protein